MNRFATAALASCLACALALFGQAEAHTGTVGISLASVVGPHTISVTYTDAVNADADHVSDSPDPSYAASLARFKSCEAGNGADCDYLLRNYRQDQYSNPTFSSGGAKRIIFVEEAGARVDLVHIDPRQPVGSRTTATFHITSSTWDGKDRWLVDLLLDSLVASVDSGQVQRGSHSHASSNLTVRATDGQPPTLSASPSLNLNTGLLLLRFTEGVNGAATDVSKISVGGVSLGGAAHSGTTGVASVTMTEAQRQAVAAVQNSGVTLTMEQGAFTDALGNKTARAADVELRLTKDTEPPRLLPLLTRLDLGAGTLVLEFHEGVRTSTDLSDITLHGANSRFVTLGGASVQERADYSKRITVLLTPAQRAAVVDPAAFPHGIIYGFRDPATFPATSGISADSLNHIRLQSGTFRDSAGIYAEFPTGSSFRLPGGLSDGAAPRILGTPNLFLADGTIRAELDEYVRVNLIDMSDFKISAPGRSDIGLSGSSVRSDGDTLLVTLTEQQRLAAVSAGGSLSLVADAGALRDLAGNPAAPISQALSAEPDRQSPSLVSAEVDEETGIMSMTFSESVDVTPSSRVVLSSVGVRAFNEQPGQAVRLDGDLGTAVLNTASDGPRLDITLTEAQRASLASHGADALLLDMDQGAVRDLSGNPTAAETGAHVNASADTKAPAFQSASLDEGTGVLQVSFSETIDTTPASSRVDLSKVRLSAADGSGSFSLSSASVDETDGAQVSVTLTEAQRQAAIAHSGDLRLAIGENALRDTAGNAVAPASGLAVSISGSDATPPAPRIAALDMGTGVLTVAFDETVDVTPASNVDLTSMAVYACPADGACAPQDRVSLSSSTRSAQAIPDDAQGRFSQSAAAALSSSTDTAILIGTSDSDTVRMLLSEAQRQAVLALSGSLQLDIGAGSLADTSGNPVAAHPAVAVSDGADTVAPSLTGASISGPDEIRAHFSEDLLGSSVSADDFEVSDHAVESVSEDAGEVTVRLTEQIHHETGQTLRVTLTGPVSDEAGNVLAAGSYADADNDLTFAIISEFTVESDNAVSSDRARTGDTVTIRFSADVGVTGTSATYVTVNSRPATVTSTQLDGFTATYAVTDSDRDGPLDISVRVRTTADDMAVSVFGAADLRKDGERQPNVQVDNTPPRYLWGSLAGFASIYAHYTEHVVTSVDDYPHVTVGSGEPHDPTGVSGSGASHHILVEWVSNWHERPIGSTISFAIGSGVTDLAGNALANPGPKEIPPIRDQETLSNLHLYGSPGVQEELALSHDTLVRKIRAAGGSVPVINIESFLQPGERHPELQEIDGTHLVFPPGDPLSIRTDSSSVTFPPDSHVAGFDDAVGRTITVDVSEREPDDAFAAAHPHIDTDAAHILEFGHPDVDLHFSHPVKIEFHRDIRSSEAVFSIDSQGATLRILECGSEVVDQDTAETFIDVKMAASVSEGQDGAACVDYGRDVIWTEHFSSFGAAPPAATSSECKDCTAPTLGLTDGGQRVVSGGFSYNDNSTDVGSFFTDYPQITAQLGARNTAILKIYDEDGPDSVRHASIAFGLRAGQSISESLAAIAWDRDHAGAETVTVVDPHGALRDDVSVTSSEVRCAPASTLECLQVSVSHTFLAPLGFDMVGTGVWDADRNVRQNYFNHGVRLVGESLVPEPGILVDGQRYYLVSEGASLSVVSDGDGNLYRLSPDGQYLPLTNASALYRVPDERGWAHASDLEPMGGYDRQDPRFAQSLAAQRAAALEVLEAMTLGEPLDNPGFGKPAELVYHEQTYGDRSDDAALLAAISAERERAALLYAQLFED